jgi:hypothetical protein
MLLVEMWSVLMLMHHRFLTPSYACGQLAPVVAVLHSSEARRTACEARYGHCVTCSSNCCGTLTFLLTVHGALHAIQEHPAQKAVTLLLLLNC